MIGKNFRVNNEPYPFCFWPQRPQRAQRGREGTRSGRGTRGGNLQECPEYRCAESNGWEAGGMSTLKTRKTASRTGTRLESGFLETIWTTRDNSYKVAGLDNSARLEGTNGEREARRRQTGQRGTRLGEENGKDAGKRPAPTFRRGGKRLEQGRGAGVKRGGESRTKRVQNGAGPDQGFHPVFQ